MTDFNELWERARRLGVGGLTYESGVGYDCTLLSTSAPGQTSQVLMRGYGPTPLEALEGAVEALEQGDRDARVASL